MINRTIGFPISHKENEKRRTIVPEDLKDFELSDCLFIEKGYGEVLGIPDSEYLKVGCRVVERDEVLSQDIICDPKIGDADYLEDLKDGTILFGWVHATENRDITDKLIKHKLSAYAWEKMNDSGRHVFWRNNELAGEAAILHAFECYGKLPYGLKVAVIGKGNTARGAIKILNKFGTYVTQYTRQTEKLLPKEIGNFDAIINCVLWDNKRKDHIITREDLKNMKPNSIIIDVSCDRNGAIETTVPTTIENPIYYVDGICHYAVDHTPTLYYKSFSYMNSKVIKPYIEQLIKNDCDDVLKNSLIFKNGEILDKAIIDFQHR